MLSSPRLVCSTTLSRTVFSGSRQYRSRPRLSNTSCPGVMHHLPPLRRRASPSLLVAVGAVSSRASPPLTQGPAVPTLSKKEHFPFPPSFQACGPTVCDALPPHSRPRPILPAVKRVRLGDAMPPHAPLASPYGDSRSSARMSQNAEPSVPSSSTPLRCTTAGTPIVPLEPLAWRLKHGLRCPARLVGSRAQFDSATRFSSPGDLPSSAAFSRLWWQLGTLLSCVRRFAVLLAKDAIEPVPPAEMRQGFYSPYFIVPKKGCGLRPILDLRLLNRALHRLPFKMLTHRRMIKCIQPRDWFAVIDLKDPCFHILILP